MNTPVFRGSVASDHLRSQLQWPFPRYGRHRGWQPVEAWCPG